MSVIQIVSMNVTETLTASIPLEVTTAAVTLAMREMDSAAQVIIYFRHVMHTELYEYIRRVHLWQNC